MKCSNCGEEILESANFCPKCGVKIEKEVKKTELENVVIDSTNSGIADTKSSENTQKEDVKQPEIIVETNVQPKEELKREKIVSVQKVTTNTQNQSTKAEERTGFSVASLVLGIVAILFVFEHGALNFISAILAIVFGAIGRKRGAKTMGTVGMWLGIGSLILLALILGIIISVIGFSVFAIGMANV